MQWSEFPTISFRNQAGYSEFMTLIGAIYVNRGNVVEMDTWVGASKKNGMRRDWLVRDLKTGQILARATRYIVPTRT